MALINSCIWIRSYFLLEQCIYALFFRISITWNHPLSARDYSNMFNMFYPVLPATFDKSVRHDYWSFCLALLGGFRVGRHGKLEWYAYLLFIGIGITSVLCLTRVGQTSIVWWTNHGRFLQSFALFYITFDHVHFSYWRKKFIRTVKDFRNEHDIFL